MCLSNAMKVPINQRVSEIVTRIRQLMNCIIFDCWPGIFFVFRRLG